MAGASRGINTAAAGNSCLEYRADNWDPSVTGAMMMASTYRLLAGERPAADKRALVLSAHHTSLGQELRNVACRFLLTLALRTYVMLDKLGTCDLVIDATADPWDAASARMFVSFRKTEGQRVVINSRHQTMYWCRAACGGGSISGRSRATKTADAAGIDLRPDHGKKRADVSRACAPRFAASPRSFSRRGLLAGCAFRFADAPPPRPQDASEGARRILPAHGLRLPAVQLSRRMALASVVLGSNPVSRISRL
jgi:hypothetical protein